MNRGRSFLVIAITGIAVFVGYQAITSNDSPTSNAEITRLIARPDIIASLTTADQHDHMLRMNINKKWIAEYPKPTPNGPIATLMSSPLSRQLKRDAALSDGQIEQIMVFDRAGCLVAADHPTHDYDQSDEDKWKRTVGAGNTKLVFEGQDADPRGTTEQVSQAVRDERGEIIGGITLRWCNTRGGCL